MTERGLLNIISSIAAPLPLSLPLSLSFPIPLTLRKKPPSNPLSTQHTNTAKTQEPSAILPRRARDAGFKSHYDFNLSCGVKPGDDDGHEEMKELGRMMRERD